MPHSIESHIFDTWPADSNSGVRSPASQPPQPADCLPQAMIAAAKEMREVMREFKEMQMATLAANARTAEITAQTRASTIERMIQANTIATETATRQHRQTVEALIAACTHTTDAHIRAANAAGRERTTQMQTLFETLHRPNEHKDLIEQSHELIKNLLTEIRDLRLQVNDLNTFAHNVVAQSPSPPRATQRSASVETTPVSPRPPERPSSPSGDSPTIEQIVQNAVAAATQPLQQILESHIAASTQTTHALILALQDAESNREAQMQSALAALRRPDENQALAQQIQDLHTEIQHLSTQINRPKELARDISIQTSSLPPTPSSSPTIEQIVQNAVAAATQPLQQILESHIAASTQTTDALILALQDAESNREAQMQSALAAPRRPDETQALAQQIQDLHTEIQHLSTQINRPKELARDISIQTSSPPPTPSSSPTIEQIVQNAVAAATQPLQQTIEFLTTTIAKIKEIVERLDQSTMSSCSEIQKLREQLKALNTYWPNHIIPVPSPAPRALQPRSHTNVLPTFPIIAQPSLIAALPANWDDLLRAVFPRRDAPLYELFLSSIPRPRCTRHHQRSAQTNWNFSVVNRSLFFFQPSAAGYRIRRIYNPHPTALLV